MKTTRTLSLMARLDWHRENHVQLVERLRAENKLLSRELCAPGELMATIDRQVAEDGREHIRRAIARHGNQRAAARALGIEQSTLWRRLSHEKPATIGAEG